MDSSQHTETSPISLIEAGERREGGGPRHTQLHTGNRTTIPITVVGQDTPLLEDGVILGDVNNAVVGTARLMSHAVTCPRANVNLLVLTRL